jgi:hypothetical protein
LTLSLYSICLEKLFQTRRTRPNGGLMVRPQSYREKKSRGRSTYCVVSKTPPGGILDFDRYPFNLLQANNLPGTKLVCSSFTWLLVNSQGITQSSTLHELKVDIYVLYIRITIRTATTPSNFSCTYRKFLDCCILFTPDKRYKRK